MAATFKASWNKSSLHGRTRLARAARKSERHSKEFSRELKRNVFGALEELGQGFIENLRANPAELEAWRVRRAPSVSAAEFLTSDELLKDVYHESLTLMYRLFFFFYAESRDLLPIKNEAYRETCSLESIRDDITATHDDSDPSRFFSRSATNLWKRLKELFSVVNEGWGNIIPAYNGGLFDPEQHGFLERFKVSDYHLARAIDLLSRTKSGGVRGEGRKKISYRDLDIRHLGSIYESILEYHAKIADEEKVIVKRGTGGKAAEEYVNVSELTADERKQLKAYREALAEDDENPALPKGCKVSGLIEPGAYYLVYGGRESKRKSSGSYYTPDYIVQYIVENTLGPLVQGRCRLKPAPMPELLRGAKGFDGEAGEMRPRTSDEILELKVLDPAMGSGHFLLAATEYLARAYGAARVREGKDPDGVMSDEEFVRYKRMVAERCIYGVDINPMAVELAKLSMWLFTMDKNCPLSFLNDHLKHGNALIGARLRDLGTPHEFDKNGKSKKSARHSCSAAASERNTFHWESEFPEIFVNNNGAPAARCGFDAVIGNPPYVSFGLRGVGKVEEDERSYFLSAYPSSSQYKLSIYAMFIDRGLGLIHHEGLCSFVLPDSFLLGKYFQQLRQSVLQHGRSLRLLTMIQESFWEDAEVGCPVILVTGKRPLGSDETIKVVYARDLEALAVEEQTYTYALPADTYQNTPLSRFYLFLSGEELDFYRRMTTDAISLAKLVKFYSGLIGRAGQKTIVLDENAALKSGHRISKIIESGRFLRQFEIEWNGQYVIHNPALYKSGYTPEYYERPKLFLNQTGDSFKACVDEQGFYCLNNMHVGYPIVHESVLYLVAGILNSELANVFYRLISMEGGRAMAQVDIDVLDLFPLPASSADDNLLRGAIALPIKALEKDLTPLERIVLLSRLLHNDVEDRRVLSKEELKKLLDDAVLEAYNINLMSFHKIASRISSPFSNLQSGA